MGEAERHAIALQILRSEARWINDELERLGAEVERLRRKDENHAALLAHLERLDSRARLARILSSLRLPALKRRKKFRSLAAQYRLIASSPLFDAAWYLAGNPDVAAGGVDPVWHYLSNGAAEGRAPGPNFDAHAYLEANPDVAGSGQNALVHYLLHGCREGRRLEPDSRFRTSRRGSGSGAPGIEPSLAVPFPYVNEDQGAGQRVAVVAHIFYDDLASELRRYLQNIPGRVDIYISTTDRAKKLNIENAFFGWANGKVEVRVTPNRGRNFGPALVEYNHVYRDSDLILHVHGKKSLHSGNLPFWRHYLMETLCGSPAIAASILDAFQRNDSLGVVAASDFTPVRKWVSWGPNFEQARALAFRMGVQIEPAAPVRFPSGAMFWARTEALRPLLELGLSEEDFEAEQGQSDGTLAHSIERLIFHACEWAGFKWMKVSRADLLLDPSAVVAVATPDDVVRYLRGNPESP